MVLQLSRMPEISFEGMNATLYRERGWCVFEDRVSAIIKPWLLLWDLSGAHDDLLNETNLENFAAVGRKCMRDRKPPCSPSEMEAALQTSKFTNGSDTDKV